MYSIDRPYAARTRPESLHSASFVVASAGPARLAGRHDPVFGQLVVQLLERFLAEVAQPQQLVLAHLQQLSNGRDLRALQAVVGTRGEIEDLDGTSGRNSRCFRILEL